MSETLRVDKRDIVAIITDTRVDNVALWWAYGGEIIVRWGGCEVFRFEIRGVGESAAEAAAVEYFGMVLTRRDLVTAPKPVLGPFRAVCKHGDSWAYTHDDLKGVTIRWYSGDEFYVFSGGRVDSFKHYVKPSTVWAEAHVQAKFAELIAEEGEKGQDDEIGFVVVRDGKMLHYTHSSLPSRRLEYSEVTTVLSLWDVGKMDTRLDANLELDVAFAHDAAQDWFKRASEQPGVDPPLATPKPQPEPDAGETFSFTCSQGIWTYRDKRVPDKRVDWNISAGVLTIWWNLNSGRATKQDTAIVDKEWVAEMMAYTYLSRHATDKMYF